ncbi:glycosyltransferase [Patescibacteria group bacterium]
MDFSRKNSKLEGKISILIPAFNESANIECTLKAVDNYMSRQGLAYEIVVVDDGSKDKTADLASRHSSDHIKVVRYRTNMGKGFAVRAAFDHSSGDVIAFFDAGLDFHPRHMLDFWRRLEENEVDIVVGSKRHPESDIDYPFKRRAISLMAQIIVKALFNLDISDTQAGIKLFRREALQEVLPRALVKRFAYDIELLSMAHRYGYKIAEAPINMKFNFRTSSVKWRWIMQSGYDTLTVFYRLKILRYYDKSSAERDRMLAKYRR